MAHPWSRLTVLALAMTFLVGCGGGGTPAPKAVPTRSSAPTTARIPLPTATAAVATFTAPPALTATRSAPTLPLPTATGAVSAVVTGLTEDGHPFWGAPDAPVTMIDFSDFM